MIFSLQLSFPILPAMRTVKKRCAGSHRERQTRQKRHPCARWSRLQRLLPHRAMKGDSARLCCVLQTLGAGAFVNWLQIQGARKTTMREPCAALRLKEIKCKFLDKFTFGLIHSTVYSSALVVGDLHLPSQTNNFYIFVVVKTGILCEV